MMGGGTAMPLSEGSVTKDIISFLNKKFVDGKITPNSNLGNVLDRASIGYQGASLSLTHYISDTYEIPIEELVGYNPREHTISQVADKIYNRKLDELFGGRK